MNLRTSQDHRRYGFGLFDLLCFVAACSTIFPLALVVSRHFEGHQRVVIFFFFMLIVYPVVGFTFAILLRRLFRFFYFRSKKNPCRDDY
jgi:hypothetical protein